MLTLGLAAMSLDVMSTPARTHSYFVPYAAAAIMARGLYHALVAAEHPSWCGAGPKGVVEDPASCTCGRAEALARYEQWRGMSTGGTSTAIPKRRVQTW